jgi:hypothetical protein
MKNKQDAQLSGDKKYQGVPCKNGHSGVRFVVNADCVECAMNRQRTTSRKEYLANYRKNSQKLKTYQAAYQKAYEQTEKVKEVHQTDSIGLTPSTSSSSSLNLLVKSS